MEAADAARAPDEITGELLDQIKDIASELSPEYEPLWANRDAFDAFKSAINVLLESHKPGNDGGGGSKFKAIYGDQKPEIIGEIIARRAVYATDTGKRSWINWIK